MQPSHFACAVIWRRSPDSGALEFLVMDCRKVFPTGEKGPVQIKFPGGTQRKNVEPPESVGMTLKREVLEETWLSLIRKEYDKIWEKRVSGTHTKYGFLVSYDRDCRGPLRKEVVVDQGDELGPPRWIPAETACGVVFHSHQGPCIEALKKLALPA